MSQGQYEVPQQGEPIENFTELERTIRTNEGRILFRGQPVEAPCLTPWGMGVVKIYAMKRGNSGVLFGVGNETPPILDWISAGKFSREWPD